ncbi:MAG: hypothetical protein WC308_02140 [archaeon]
MIQINDSKKLSKFAPFPLKAFSKIVEIYEVKKGNNVLIWCDTGGKKEFVSPRLGKTFYKKFLEMGCKVSIIVERKRVRLGSASKKTNEAVLSLGKGDFFVSFSSGGRGYIVRKGKQVLFKQLIAEQGFKIACASGLASLSPKAVNSFFESFDHDAKEINCFSKKLVPILARTKSVKVSCPLGTNLEMRFGSRGAFSNDGNWKVYSTNYPLGEVYAAPLENSVKGVAFVSSAHIIGKTIKPKKPVKFVFHKGIMLYSDNKEVNFSIARTVAFNKEKIGNYKLAPRTIAEFGIGTNKKAKILGVMICDEKTLGSCHFALGNNLSMGGKNDCYGHFDYVIANPTVWADGKKIVEGGKILL